MHSSITFQKAFEGLIQRSTQTLNYNSSIWQQGMKLNLLQSKQFLQWYEYPRYWVFYKLAKVGQKQIEKVKVKVSNHQMCQFSESTNRFLPCELQYHKGVKIQTFEENQAITKNYQAMVKELTEFQTQTNDLTFKDRLGKRLKELQTQYFGLCSEWREQTSTQRIIILTKGEEYKDLTFFIYQQQQEYQEFKFYQWPNKPLTLKTSKESLLFMKEIIKIHHSKRQNQKILKKIKHIFKNSIQQSFIDAFKQHKLESESQKASFGSNQELINAFKRYDLNQSRSFVQKLKEAVKKSKTSLFVEVFSIWINKSNVPVSVKLIVDGAEPKKYEYKYFQNDYLVYSVSEENERKYTKINIQNSRVFRKYSFEVEIRFKNSEVVKYSNDHVVFVLQKRENLFVQELILENQLLFDQQNDASCIIYFNQIFSRTQKINSLVQYYEASIFKNVGIIPSKYSTSYQINYNPNTYKTIRTLLSNDSYGSKLSKVNYQKTYYELVRLSQKEENQSQRTILLTNPSKRNNAFAMKERYEIYNKKILQAIGYFSSQETLQYYFHKNYEKLASNLTGNQKNIIVSKVQYKNFIQDLKLYKVRNLSMLKKQVIKFIYFSNQVQKVQSFPYTLRYSSHLIPIFDSLLEIYLNSKQGDLGRSSISGFYSTNYLFSFIAFLAKMYPYSDIVSLKSDLYILRWLVQKKLPYFNDYLNRNNIGLENLISDHLLHLFTGLPSELTYRIWDYLISNQKKESRIIIAFTLLTYLETTNTLTIIPINQFMQRVQLNAKKISVDKEFATKFAKVSQTYFSNEQAKHNRLIKHLKGNKQSSIIQDRILKKMILGESKLKIPYEEQGKIPISKNTDKSNNLTIKQLSYPLPQPNYRGYSIIEIVLFIHDLQILQNINLNSNKYWIKFTIPDTEWKQYIQIVQKNYFYNKPIKIANQFINFFRPNEKNKKMGERHIKVSIVSNANLNGRDQSKEKIELKGFIDYGLYEKDKAYKLSTALNPDNHHNKGRTILNLSICLKSHMYNEPLPPKINFESLETLSQKLLDYDIGESNQCVAACSKLAASLQKIKYPLDQFSSDQNKRIANKALNEHDPQWLRSSSTSIEELKAIFYNLFAQEKDKSIKHEFSKLYEIFAEDHNMQFVYLAQILVKFVLLSKISRKKKLMYLFCTAVHYQNCYSKKMNYETLNSLIRLIFNQYSFINACPYMEGSCGKIVEAYYFESDLKSELKKDFTEIVQDWAYICNFKYAYGDIILGSSRDLSILRSFFDIKTLKKMEQQKECRFQIIYEVEGCKYLWSAVVETKTFEILKRGTKFLNQFTGYSPIQYLNSTQEYLLNCENVIPLTYHKGFTYQQFTQAMLSNHLIRYLMDLDVFGHPNKKEDFIYGFQNNEEENDDQNGEPLADDSQFNSWALIRGQNCLQSWRRCVVIHPGKVMSKIKYESDDCEYNVASLDVINMQEVDIHQSDSK